MATNQLTLLRQWHMLRMIPRGPGKITTQDLRSRLSADDFVVTERTIQRDLNELATVFPLVVDDRERPYGWSWYRDAASFDLPGLATPEALMLKMVEQHLRHQLPPTTLDSLAPYFKSADQALASIGDHSNAQSWLKKVRTVPPMQPLLPPEMDAASQRTVYEALMRDRQLALTYRKRGAQAPTIYDVVHPLAIVQRGPLTYLVCLFADYKDRRLLALHRIEAATMLEATARTPVGFSIDAYIRSGKLGFASGDEISLHAIFSRQAGEHLFETPLSLIQKLKELPDGRLQLTVTLPDTKELLWWLLGLGAGVEVIRPTALRRQIKEIIAAMGALYQ